MVGNANANGIPFLKRYGIPPAIKNSMVLWYDIARQGATNESMAKNPILKDLSGNGHDITCYNFAWSGMSGIGCYTNFKVDTSRANIEILGEQHWLINSINQDNTVNRECILCRKQDFATFFCGKTIQVKLTGNVLSESYFRINSSRTYLKEGVNEITIPAIDSEDFINGPYLIFIFPLETVNVELEILPLYPNALVSDGIDDYAYVEGLPILTDYTIIAKRTVIDKEKPNCIFATKGETGLANKNHAFAIDIVDQNSNYYYSSFGSLTGPISKFNNYDLLICTKNKINDKTITPGDTIDNFPNMNLFGYPASNRYIVAALYSFLLFNRTLTADEIEWVKTNLISISTNE